MEPTDRFYKFDLFKKLIEEITNLISEMQKQLIVILNQNPTTTENPIQNKTNKLGLFQRLKSMWPFNRFVKENLHNYLLFNKEIENICEEIIIENFGLILESKDDQISQILIKFNNDFKAIVEKYSKILQKDYEKEKEIHTRRTGIPDETAEEVIRTATENASSAGDAVNRSIARVLKNKSKSSSFSTNWLENGEIKFEYFGEVLDYLLNEGIDIEKEEQVKSALGSNYKPESDFYSKLLKIFKNKDEIIRIEAKIINRDLIIGSVEELADAFVALAEDEADSGNLIDSIFKEISELDKNEQKRKDKIIEYREREKDNKDLQWKILFNISINDDLRREFIKLVNSPSSKN